MNHENPFSPTEASSRRLPTLAATNLLSRGSLGQSDPTRQHALPHRQQGINLDERLPLGDPWAYHPQKKQHSARLPKTTGVPQLGSPLSHFDYGGEPVPHSSQYSVPNTFKNHGPQAHNISSANHTSNRTFSNKRRRSVPLEERSSVAGTVSPSSVQTPSSSNAGSWLQDDDRRVWNGEKKRSGRQAVVPDGLHSNDKIFSTPAASTSHITTAGSLVENSERRARTIDEKHYILTERDLYSNSIANMKRKLHSSNEYIRRREETRRIAKIDGLLPPELLVDSRMGNLKQGHTKLQILDAACNLLEVLTDDIKQYAVEKCRESLERATQSPERHPEVGTGRWNADAGPNRLSSMLIQTPPPSNQPSPRDARFG